MVFSSIVFIFRFIPIAFLLYYITPRRFRNLTLLFLSLFFYSWGEPKYILLMLVSIFVDYLAGFIISKHRHITWIKRSALIMSIVYNMGTLFLFKYIDFFIETSNSVLGTNFRLLNIALPLGISFYTFQTLSYTIDVYLDKAQAEYNIITFATFVTLFPQLIAGPIVKYKDISAELKERFTSLSQLQDGITDFIIGLTKKVLIANNVGSLWTEVQSIGFNNVSTPLAWLSLLAFALQIYFDFSGYSTMAIGLGKMLGFDFPQNFNFPYISKSITDFWRRWHITLGSWFKEYLYFPLGGSRVSGYRLYFNLFVVWAFTGLWHGASWNFVLWGLFFFVLISIEKAGLLNFLEHHTIIARVYTLLLLLIGWGLFATVDLNEFNTLTHTLFTYRSGHDFIYYLSSYAAILTIGCICATPLIKQIQKKISHYTPLLNIIYITLFLLSVAYLVDATYNPFLYFRF